MNTYTYADTFVLTALESGALVDDANANLSAINAAGNAYYPYSRFRVGAALLTVTGSIYAGCNVENIMYSGMSHAELTAIAAAITAEGSDILIAEMVVYTPTTKPCPPCGGCRQLIREHAVGLNTRVWSHCEDPTLPPLGVTIAELLPHRFGSENLK